MASLCNALPPNLPCGNHNEHHNNNYIINHGVNLIVQCLVLDDNSTSSPENYIMQYIVAVFR